MNIVKMKKAIIFVLLGTIITACSTQKKAVEVANATPSPQSVKVESINEQKQEEPIVAKEAKEDTIATASIALQPTKKDTVVRPQTKDEKVVKAVRPESKSIYGHVNMRTVISNMAEYKDALQHMDSLQKYLANQYEMMVQEFQKKEAEYSEDTTSLPMVQQMRQQELQSLVDRIKYFQQTSQQQLELEENKLMVPIYEKMRNVIKQVSDELHLLAVFDDSYLLYSSADAADITNDVIKKLK